MNRVAAVFGLAVYIGLISTTLGQLPLPIEKRFTVSDKFQSVVCRSPHVSFAPYWTVDVNGTALTENEVSRDYGAIVQRDSDGEGHYISVLTIPAVNLTLNDSTITCLVNFTVVILQYHLIIAEVVTVQVNMTNVVIFQSDVCVSPSVNSPPPYFSLTFTNNVTFQLNAAEVNEYYKANVSRSVSPEGHHQAVLTIHAVNSTLNDCTITCWVKSSVRLQYHLITDVDQSSTTTAMEFGTTSDTIDGTNQDVNVDVLSKSSDSSDVSWITAPISVLFIIVIAGVISACITWYVCKQRKCRRTNKPKSIESAPDYTNQQQQLPPSSSQPPAASPVSYHDVSQQVTGVSKNGRVRQHEYVPSFSRHSDDKNMTDVGDSSVLDMTTSTYLHPLSCSFEDREDISETLMLPPAVPKSREEQGTSEGQSLAIPSCDGSKVHTLQSGEEQGTNEGQSLTIPSCDGSKMQSAYDSLGVTKCWNLSIHGSTRHCQFVQCGSSGISDEGKD